MSDLGIVCFRCNKCGAEIYPPSIISKKAERKIRKRIHFPKPVDDLPDFAIFSWRRLTDTQKQKVKQIAKEAGLSNWDKPDTWTVNDIRKILDYIKSKYPLVYSAIKKKLRAIYTAWRDNIITQRRLEAEQEEKNLSKVALNIKRSEDSYGINIEADRFEAKIEGDDKKGLAKCPKCGAKLAEWRV